MISFTQSFSPETNAFVMSNEGSRLFYTRRLNSMKSRNFILKSFGRVGYVSEAAEAVTTLLLLSNTLAHRVVTS